MPDKFLGKLKARASAGASIENVSVILAVNLALFPPVLLLAYSGPISEDFEVALWWVKGLYGLYFIAASLGGRVLSKFWEYTGIKYSLVVGGVGLLLTGFVLTASESFIFFSLSFVVIAGFVSGSPFFSPVSAFVVTRVGRGSAFALAIATVGQMTAFVFWMFFIKVFAFPTWASAFLVSSVVSAIIVFAVAAVFSRDRKSASSYFQGQEYPVSGTVFQYAVIVFCVYFIVTTFVAQYIGQLSLGLVFLFSITAAASRIFMSVAYDNGHQVETHRIALGCLLVSVFVFGVFRSEALGTAFLAVAYGSYPPIIMARGIASHPDSLIELNSKLFLGGSFGLFTGSFFMPMLAGHMTVHSLVVVSVALVLAFVLLNFRKHTASSDGL